MSDDLYNRAILDRAKDATAAGTLPDAQARATLDNPLCGDRVTMELSLADGRIAAIAHKVRGCALCQASASIIGAHAIGQTAEQLTGARGALKGMLTGGAAPNGAWQELALFAPAQAHRSRHDCVLLPWEALEQALTEAAKGRG
jgi:nitrogen fixation protein NifU and related proteins